MLQSEQNTQEYKRKAQEAAEAAKIAAENKEKELAAMEGIARQKEQNIKEGERKAQEAKATMEWLACEREQNKKAEAKKVQEAAEKAAIAAESKEKAWAASKEKEAVLMQQLNSCAPTAPFQEKLSLINEIFRALIMHESASVRKKIDLFCLDINKDTSQQAKEFAERWRRKCAELKKALRENNLHSYAKLFPAIEQFAEDAINEKLQELLEKEKEATATREMPFREKEGIWMEELRQDDPTISLENKLTLILRIYAELCKWEKLTHLEFSYNFSTCRVKFQNTSVYEEAHTYYEKWKEYDKELFKLLRTSQRYLYPKLLPKLEEFREDIAKEKLKNLRSGRSWQPVKHPQSQARMLREEAKERFPQEVSLVIHNLCKKPPDVSILPTSILLSFTSHADADFVLNFLKTILDCTYYNISLIKGSDSKFYLSSITLDQWKSIQNYYEQRVEYWREIEAYRLAVDIEEAVSEITSLYSKNCSVQQQMNNDLYEFSFEDENDAALVHLKFVLDTPPEIACDSPVEKLSQNKYGFSMTTAQCEWLVKKILYDFDLQYENLKILLEDKNNGLSFSTRKYLQEKFAPILAKKEKKAPISMLEINEFKRATQNLPLPLFVKIAIAGFIGAALTAASIMAAAAVSALAIIAPPFLGAAGSFLFFYIGKHSQTQDKEKIDKALAIFPLKPAAASPK
ncbi:MAG: hypothetical protein K0S27_260 [Gammaproteobacteria bacterium]|jgi:hypothetical protein|nr:hypothetical protein [Gammaproteobacteria bacterium]